MSATVYTINHFFDEYANAIAIRDSKHITECFALPCIFIADDKTSAYSTASKLEGLANQGKRFYNTHNITAVRADVVSKKMFTPRVAQAQVRWFYYNSNGKEVYNCDYNYLLRSDEHNKWKIETAVSINEKEKLEAIS